MPVMIAGMHRSHTSMTARLLNELGLFVGPKEDLDPASDDNREGFWEDRRFQYLNEELLNQLGGSWDRPPLAPPDYLDSAEIEPYLERASTLARSNAEHSPWGWKDPRNCLTLDFWARAVEDIRVVVVIRHPLGVAQSLRYRTTTRTMSYAEGIDLWLTYHRKLLFDLKSHPVLFTHSDAILQKGRLELDRLGKFASLNPSEEQIKEALRSVRRDLVLSTLPASNLREQVLPTEVLILYQELCEWSEFVPPKPSETTLESALQGIQRLQALLERKCDRVADLEQLVEQLENSVDEAHALIKVVDERAETNLAVARRDYDIVNGKLDRLRRNLLLRFGKSLMNAFRGSERGL